MPDILQHTRIGVFIHQDQAAESLNNGQQVVELVGQTAKQFLVEAFACFASKIEVGGENKLHGRRGLGVREELG